MNEFGITIKGICHPAQLNDIDEFVNRFVTELNLKGFAVQKSNLEKAVEGQIIKKEPKT